MEDIKGAEVYGIRLKAPADIQSKLDNGKEPKAIGDVLGGRIVVDSPEALAGVLDRLDEGARTFSHDDKLADRSPTGYRAFHLQVDGVDRRQRRNPACAPRDRRRA